MPVVSFDYIENYEQLRAENERLRAALADILDGFGLAPPHYVGAEIDADDLWIVNRARAALEGK